ncbi:hypothetical protein AAMO2058_001135300 [Amorphochlora amoebiformis]
MFFRLFSLKNGAYKSLRVKRWLCNAAETVKKPVSFAARYPFTFGVAITMLKTQAADILTQIQFERRETIDYNRLRVFTIFGFFYLGGCQYFLYNKLMPWCFPRAVAFTRMSMNEKLTDVRGMMQVIGQVFLDLGVHIPFVYMPAYYTLKEAILSHDDGPILDKIKAGLTKYRKNLSEDWAAALKIWIPADLINFGLMPMHMRLPFMAFVSFGWTCLLSFMRGAGDKLPAAKKVASELPKADKILEKIRALHDTYSENGNLREEGFTKALAHLGITDEQAILSLFHAMDVGGEGYITFPELSSALLLLAPDVHGDDQMKFIYSAFDLNNNGEIEMSELTTMLTSILISKETLLVTYPEEDGLDAMSAMTLKMKSALTEEGIRAKRDKRLQEYKAKSFEHAECKTLNDCIRVDARRLAEKIFLQADMDQDSRISFNEFKDWYEKRGEEAIGVRNLFGIFAPKK